MDVVSERVAMTMIVMLSGEPNTRIEVLMLIIKNVSSSYPI